MMRRLLQTRWLGVLLVACAVIAATRQEPADPPWFERVTQGAAVTDGGQSRGVAWGDFDGDGDPDLIVTNTGGQWSSLYRNDSVAGFVELRGRLPVTRGASSEGASWIDIDNDGDLDLFVANIDSLPNFLFENVGGGALRRVTHGPIVEGGVSTSMGCWADADGDGLLDVYLSRRHGQPGVLLRNRGAFRFEVVAGPWEHNRLESRACAWGDADGDGDMDLLSVNFARTRNAFYRNDGGGRFTEITSGVFVTKLNNAYGATFADLDNDGDADLLVANVGAGLDLYRNERGVYVRDTADVLGRTRGYSKGLIAADFDADGDLDVFVANGTEQPGTQNALFENRGGHFVRRVEAPLTTDSDTSAGAAAADHDRDGDLDLFVANWGSQDQDNAFYRNRRPRGRSIIVQLVGTRSNRMGIGARAELSTNANRQTRWMDAQTGYASQSAPELFFGMGDAVRAQLVVAWPSGVRDTIAEVTANAIWRVVEGSRRADLVRALRPSAANDALLRAFAVVSSSYPAWGRGLLAFQSDRDGNLELYVADTMGRAPRRVTHHPAADVTPAWSPDGSRLAFASERDGNPEVYVMNADGSQLRNLSNNSADDSHPRWSADGRHVYFSSDRAGERESHIYRVRPDGTQLEQITTGRHFDTFPWPSPDGAAVTFRRSVAEPGLTADLRPTARNSEIFVRDLATGTDRPVAPSPAYDGWPSWSSDGAWIAFASNRTGKFEVYIVRPDGSDLTQVTAVSGHAMRPSWSPDGSRIAFTRTADGRTEIAIVPVARR